MYNRDLELKLFKIRMRYHCYFTMYNIWIDGVKYLNFKQG